LLRHVRLQSVSRDAQRSARPAPRAAGHPHA
jgi:hypothetical protein